MSICPDDLTIPQYETLHAVIEFHNRNSYMPALQNLADALDISITAVVKRLGYLEDKGYMLRVEGISRGIILKEKAKTCKDIHPAG